MTDKICPCQVALPRQSASTAPINDRVSQSRPVHPPLTVVVLSTTIDRTLRRETSYFQLQAGHHFDCIIIVVFRLFTPINDIKLAVYIPAFERLEGYIPLTSLDKHCRYTCNVVSAILITTPTDLNTADVCSVIATILEIHTCHDIRDYGGHHRTQVGTTRSRRPDHESRDSIEAGQSSTSSWKGLVEGPR